MLVRRICIKRYITKFLIIQHRGTQVRNTKSLTQNLFSWLAGSERQ